MIWFLRIACSLVLLAMLGVTTWASTFVALWEMPREVATHPWFIATLFDTYFAFLTFWAWVAYKETTALARTGWLIAILLLGIFPILGSTTILCGLAAYWLRLNQPIIHLVHYFAYPAQLALLIPFYRAGSTLFGQPHIPLSLSFLIDRFRADAWQFLGDFGMIGVRGIVVWCLVAPLLAAAVYFAVRPPLRALARRVSVV